MKSIILSILIAIGASSIAKADANDLLANCGMTVFNTIAARGAYTIGSIMGAKKLRAIRALYRAKYNNKNKLIKLIQQYGMQKFGLNFALVGNSLGVVTFGVACLTSAAEAKEIVDDPVKALNYDEGFQVLASVVGTDDALDIMSSIARTGDNRAAVARLEVALERSAQYYMGDDGDFLTDAEEEPVSGN